MKILKSIHQCLLTVTLLFACNQVLAQPLSEDIKPGWCAETPTELPDIDTEKSWALWGGNTKNHRSATENLTNLNAETIPQLDLMWAYAVSDTGPAGLMRSQPSVAGNWLWLASIDGSIRAIHARKGCLLWQIETDSRFFSGTALTRLKSGESILLAGDLSGAVHAFDPFNGSQLWSRQISDHPTARISGTPVPHDGVIYVPVSSGEWATPAAGDPEYECCTFRGKVAALDAETGEFIWEYHTIDDMPEIQGENERGTTLWGPSGAGVWSGIAIDEKRKKLYFGTGNNYSYPATKTSSAIHAVDMESGERAWIFQGTDRDVWVVTCMEQWVKEHNLNSANCPEDHGPDFDFGAAPILVTTESDRDLLIAGQKSGMVFALDPDSNGDVIWKSRAGRGGILGGIHFGMAIYGDRLIVPVSDRDDGELYDHEPKPGVVAIDITDGNILWSTPGFTDTCEGKEGCHSSFSAPATALPGVVLAGALDGHLQAFSMADGKRIWSFDTARAFETVNGEPGHGGAMSAAGPVVIDDMVFVLSGYGAFAGQMPGNLLLAFSIQNP